jgi:hypothetical protein
MVYNTQRYWVQWLRLALSKGLPSPEDGNRSSFRNVVFFNCYLGKIRTMDKVRKPNISVLSLGILLTYTDAARTRTYRKHITWSLTSQSIGAFVGPTENTRHVTVTYCCVTPPRTQGKHSFLYCCVRVFRALPRDDVLLLLRVRTCLRSCGLAMGIHITIHLCVLYIYCLRYVVLLHLRVLRWLV